VEAAIERAATYAQFECLRREIAKAILLARADEHYEACSMAECVVAPRLRKQAAALGEEGECA
jgi:hypothetical protein